jgi:hypothetical protein
VRPCGACGGAYRAGTRALVFTHDGSSARRLICGGCAKRGLLVVALTMPPKVIEKSVRSEAVAQTLRMLRTYAAAARATGGPDPFALGRAEGLDVAIETLTRNADGAP